jgi:CheY-like chemotaxis protein
MNKPKILIVDDDLPLSRLVQISLEKTRLYQTRVENHSTRALRTTREFRPDLILLDIDMPVIDGGEVARQIRTDDSLRETPIIFFTSLLSQSEAGRGLVDRGGDHFLAKPIDAPVLIRSIESLLNPVVAQ